MLFKNFLNNNILIKTQQRFLNMDLKQVINRIEEYGNSKIAQSWDNVGLLVEPSGDMKVEKIFLTNDLTEPVLEEAIAAKANLIVTYHPAIFNPLKRLTQADWKQRTILKCIENRIAVYSPHTTWDTIQGGINDWIFSAFDMKRTEPIDYIKTLTNPTGFNKTLKINVSNKDEFLRKLNLGESNSDLKFVTETKVNDLVELEFLSSAKGVLQIIDQIGKTSVLETLRILDLDKPFMKDAGLGRIGYLSKPAKIRDVVERLKEHLNLKHVRVALANNKTLDNEVKVFGVCAGSGSKLLNNINVDLLITGEFSHHEVLHEVHRGVTLILTDHSNNERGYLSIFKKNFSNLLSKYGESLEIIISQIDRDPLEVI